MPISYRACSSSNAAFDDLSKIPASVTPKIALEMQSGLDGMFYGCSNTRMRDITDGTSNTIMIGESYTDPEYVKDGQGMDFRAFGSPQTGGWDCIPGDLGGTEYSEGLGSFVVLRVMKMLRMPAVLLTSSLLIAAAGCGSIGADYS